MRVIYQSGAGPKTTHLGTTLGDGNGYHVGAGVLDNIAMFNAPRRKRCKYLANRADRHPGRRVCQKAVHYQHKMPSTSRRCKNLIHRPTSTPGSVQGEKPPLHTLPLKREPWAEALAGAKRTPTYDLLLIKQYFSISQLARLC